MARLPLFLTAFVISVGGGVAAFDRELTDLAISDALAVARSPNEASRRAFHGNYYQSAGPPPLTSINVVTAYRRVVIAAEDRLRLGDRLWGLTAARSVASSFRNRVDIVADLNFHPQNAYATVPAIEIAAVLKDGPEITPVQISRTAKYGLLPASPNDVLFYPYPPPSLPAGPGADTILGAWVVASFDALELDPKAYVVVIVREGGKDLARVAVDFGRIR
jgi:hypothetical protein